MPILSIILPFTVSAIQGQVFGPDYLSVISLVLLYCRFPRCIFTLHLSQQLSTLIIKNKLDKEAASVQLRETASQKNTNDYPKSSA